MTGKTHRYSVAPDWTGNPGTGTSAHRAYARDFVLHGEGAAGSGSVTARPREVDHPPRRSR